MNEQELHTALGPLAPLYSDPGVSEIMVDAPDRVYVERRGKLEDADVAFDSPEAIQAVIDAILASGDIALGPHQTTGQVRLPDGSRFLAVIPPTATEGPCLVIRKFPRVPLTWEDLFRFGSLTREAYALLERAIRAQVSLLVVGGPGSGKTTITNLLAGSLPAQERVVVVEETHEMQVAHPRRIALEVASPANLSFLALLDTAARMRPDWLVIGELRGPDALHVLQILSMGLTGITTIHATSPEDALARLETMCLMANLGLGLSQIRALIASALGLIVCQERLLDGSRKMTHIVELRGVEGDRFLLQPLFQYNAAEGKLEATGAQAGWANSSSAKT